MTESEPNQAAPLETVRVLPGRLPTAGEVALLEYGRQLTLKSVETVLDFHRTMLGVSATFGALVTSIAPILAWGDKDAKLPMPEGWLLILPTLLMVCSSGVFAIGYLPKYKELSVSVVEDVRRSREEILRSRRALAALGMALFCAALLLTVILSVGLPWYSR